MVVVEVEGRRKKKKTHRSLFSPRFLQRGLEDKELPIEELFLMERERERAQCEREQEKGPKNGNKKKRRRRVFFSLGHKINVSDLEHRSLQRRRQLERQNDAPSLLPPPLPHPSPLLPAPLSLLPPPLLLHGPSQAQLRKGAPRFPSTPPSFEEPEGARSLSRAGKKKATGATFPPPRPAPPFGGASREGKKRTRRLWAPSLPAREIKTHTEMSLRRSWENGETKSAPSQQRRPLNARREKGGKRKEKKRRRKKNGGRGG